MHGQQKKKTPVKYVYRKLNIYYVISRRIIESIVLESTHLAFSLNYYTLTPGRYNPCSVLTDSRSRLQPSLSLALILQLVTPSLSASRITPSIHLRFGPPTRRLPSGLSRAIFLHGRLSCVRTICPAHLNLVILFVVTKSVASYRRYSSSLYLDLHVTSSQRVP